MKTWKPKWQDALLSLGGIGFIAGLIPSVLGEMKPEPITSLATGLILVSFLTVYVSYRLWMTVLLTAVTAVLWLTLFVQAL